MKIGIDLDGTLDKYPEKFELLIYEWIRQGNEVHVITGTLNKQLHKAEEGKNKKLKRLNLDIKGIFLTVVRGKTIKEVGKRKGLYCREQMIDMMIEDTELYLEEIKNYSPYTLCLLLK